MSEHLDHGDGLVLAIDLGTGGPKVALIDQAGATVAWASRPVRTVLFDGGGAEQDPREMWSAIVEATHAALFTMAASRPDVADPAGRVAALAVTSQYMSTVPVDATGLPTGPCILWMDTRGAAHNLSLLTDESFILFAERHGLIPLPSGNDNVAHVHVLRQHHPDAYAGAAAFVEPMDYVNARLTGVVQATQSTAFGMLACDNRTWGTSEYDSDLVAAAQLDPDKLAPLAPLNGFVGELITAAASELGLPAGIPVAHGTIDSITSAIGAGALHADSGAMIIGTTSVLVTHIGEQRNDLGRGILTVPSPLADSYYVMAENGIGGRALEWAMQLLGYGDDFTTGESEAAATPAGAAGVQCFPWLLGSIAPQPNDDVRAAYVGLSLHHDRTHLLRATFEGVAVNLAWLLPAVEAFTATQFEVLRFGGGGALSALWAQVLADACCRPVHRLAEPRTTNARGAALLAFADLGWIDIADTPALLRTAQLHEPDDAAHTVYAERLATLQRLHPVLGAM